MPTGVDSSEGNGRRGRGGSMGDIFLEGFDVIAEGFQAGGSQGASGAGHLAFEALLDGDISRRGELFDLDAEVACGGSGLLLDICEIS